MSEPERPDRLILVSKEFMERLATRDSFGNAIHVEWGEPDDAGLWEPTFGVDYADNVVHAALTELRAEVKENLWRTPQDGVMLDRVMLGQNIANEEVLRLIDQRLNPEGDTMTDPAEKVLADILEDPDDAAEALRALMGHPQRHLLAAALRAEP